MEMDDGDGDDRLLIPIKKLGGITMSISLQPQARVLSTELFQHVNQEITLMGWAHKCRYLGNLSFISVRDRKGIVQCVLEGELASIVIETESVVSIRGKVVPHPNSEGVFEIQATNVEIMNAAMNSLPFEINKKEVKAGLDTILDNRVLSLRNPKLHAVLTIQSVLVRAFQQFLSNQGFTQIFTPKIVASGTEGGSNLFPLQYFEKEAYLAQSPQFYKQMMVGAGYERVFEIAPAYRAEEHNTSRHLNEYISLDVEMGFIESEEDLMELETALLREMFQAVQVECTAEVELLGISIPQLSDIPRIPVAEAQAILESKYGKQSPKGDLDPEGERLICQYIAEQGKPAFVFITDYPREIRPMYAKPNPSNPALTSSFDLLFNGLEVTTGGQRIHQFDLLVDSMKDRGLSSESFGSYLDTFKYGMPPHGGFAIGLERLTAQLIGLSNVRHASAFPRDRTRLTP